MKILQASVGGITAADIVLADASEAVVIGFNVAPDNDARRLADEKQVEIRRYDVIYKVTDDIRMMLEGKLKPEEKMVELGHAMVQQAFSISRVGTIAGCRVVQGGCLCGGPLSPTPARDEVPNAVQVLHDPRAGWNELEGRLGGRVSGREFPGEGSRLLQAVPVG